MMSLDDQIATIGHHIHKRLRWNLASMAKIYVICIKFYIYFGLMLVNGHLNMKN